MEVWKKPGAWFGGICTFLWDMKPYSQVSLSYSQPKVDKELAWATKLHIKPDNISSSHVTKQIIFLIELDWLWSCGRGND